MSVAIDGHTTALSIALQKRDFHNIRSIIQHAIEWKKSYIEKDSVHDFHNIFEQRFKMRVLGPLLDNLQQITEINPPELEELY